METEQYIFPKLETQSVSSNLICDFYGSVGCAMRTIVAFWCRCARHTLQGYGDELNENQKLAQAVYL